MFYCFPCLVGTRLLVWLVYCSSVCLSVCLSVYLSVYCLSVCLSVFLWYALVVCLDVARNERHDALIHLFLPNLISGMYVVLVCYRTE